MTQEAGHHVAITAEQSLLHKQTAQDDELHKAEMQCIAVALLGLVRYDSSTQGWHSINQLVSLLNCQVHKDLYWPVVAYDKIWSGSHFLQIHMDVM